MTEKQVIEKAIKDYPIGTLVEGINRFTERIVSQRPLFTNSMEIWFEAEIHNIRLYNGHQWATVIENSKQIYEIF